MESGLHGFLQIFKRWRCYYKCIQTVIFHSTKNTKYNHTLSNTFWTKFSELCFYYRKTSFRIFLRVVLTAVINPFSASLQDPWQPYNNNGFFKFLKICFWTVQERNIYNVSCHCWHSFLPVQQREWMHGAI